MAFIGNNPKWNTATHTPQSADPSNPVEGMIFYSDGTSRAEGFWVYTNSQWVRVGKESGGLDVFYTNDFEEDSASDLTSGNNASFDGGGTIAGTLADETASPISKARSISYTQAAGSLNDYFHTGAISLDEKQQKDFVELSFYSTYDGNDDEVIAVIYDDTNGSVLEEINIKSSSNSLRNEIRSFIPGSCSSIKVGFQVVVENIGAELVFDDFEIKMETVNEISWREEQTIQHTANASTMLDLSAEVRFNTSNLVSEGVELLSIVDNAASTRTEFTANVDCIVDITLSVQCTGAGQHYINVNSSPVVIGDRQGTANTYGDAQVTGLRLNAGDYITFQHDSGSWRSTTSPAYVYIKASRPLEAFTKSSRVPENVFSARIENNGTVSITSESSPFLDTFNRTGTGQIDWTFKPGMFTEPPSVLVKVTGSGVNAGDSMAYNVTTSGFSTASFNSGNSFTDHEFDIIVQRQGNDYRDPRKAFLFLNQSVYLKDVKPNSTGGGTFTSGSPQTRVLNTKEGSASWCSLSSNQFTLAPGRYSIQGEAPAYQVNGHRAWIHNVTDGTDDLIGSGEYAGVTNANCNITSRILGEIEITDTKTFELRHQCQTTASDGFGTAGFVGSLDEVFSIVKITRVG